MTRQRYCPTIIGITLAFSLLASGCTKSPPAVTEVTGTLLLNNQPLPFAQVDFMPELSSFGAQYNSTAVTDERGRFTLICANGEAGAAVATHRVIVFEGPPPDGARGTDGPSQTRLGEYMSKLANRPIPLEYGNYAQTPLRMEVKKDQKEYIINMTR